MPVADLTPQYRELGRLKLGEELDNRPSRLDTWRLTSPHRDLLEAAAAAYGGTVNAWTPRRGGGSGWELTTDRAELEVLIPPQDIAEGQYWELWAAGGVERRCTGLLETLTGRPCICNLEGRQVCKLTTHLRVILPELPDLGVWRLTTRSQHAAREFLGSLEVLTRLYGERLPQAVLAIEARSVIREGTTHRFTVPVLRTRSTLVELMEIAGDIPESEQLGGGSDRLPPPPAPAATAALDGGPRAGEQPIEPETAATAPQMPQNRREPEPGADLQDPEMEAAWDDLGALLADLDPTNDPRMKLEGVLPAIFALAEKVGLARVTPTLSNPAGSAFEAALERWADATDPAVLNLENFRTFAQRAHIELFERYRTHPAGRARWAQPEETR